MPVKTVSIKDLQRELKTKKRALALLRVRRAKALARLTAIDKEIAPLVGGPSAPAKPRRKKAAPKRKAAPAPGKRRRATGKPLLAYMREVLAKVPKGIRAKDITTAVTKAGYKSYSKDFYAVVARTLLDRKTFKRVSRGVYVLTGK